MHKFIRTSLQFLACFFVLFQGDVQARCCPGETIDVSAGTGFSLALRNNGTIWAWGRNDFGQVGDGSTDPNTDSPGQVVTSPSRCEAFISAIAISAGSFHSLAVKSDLTVWSWGNNSSGQLGIGSTGGFSNIPVQVLPVASFNNIIDVAAGTIHSLALKNNGTVWAWGGNSNGQLGNGSNILSNVPIQVVASLGGPAFTGAIALAAGTSHSLALKSDGTIWAWGNNSSGQLGNGSNLSSNVPVQVSNLTNVIAIAAGASHSLALRSDGTIWAWGNNNFGQLGNGTFVSSNVPVQVSNLTDVIAIAGGGVHSLALREDGTVWAWGAGGQGQLGNGSFGVFNVPVPVSNLTDVIAIAGGNVHSIALKSDLTIWSWGDNIFGELGIGVTGGNSNVPVQTNGLK